MNAPYEIVDVIPDTPEWLEERRKSVGASEVAAVMSMSSYGVTPLDIYKSKHGIDREFDPVLAFIGHASEPIMHEWVEQFSGLNLTLGQGFMARSTEWPFLHASFDRVASDGTKVQMKTAHHYSGHHWDEGVPTDIRVQVQAEMAVSGDPRALVIVWIGGREFRLFWEPRDDRFIREHLVPAVQAFWEGNVLAGVAPEPSTLAEVNQEWPSEPKPIEASETALDMADRRAVLLSDAKSMEEEADALKLALAQYMGTADTLTYQGRKVLTFKSQRGRTSFDRAALEADHPDIVAAYTRQGADFRVMRYVKEKK